MIRLYFDEPNGLEKRLRPLAISHGVPAVFHFVPLFDFEREHSPSFIGCYYVEN